MWAVLNPLFMEIHLVSSPESSAVMNDYHYTSNFKLIADLHPERARPLIKRLESVSLARLPSGLVSRPPGSIPPGKQHTIMLTVQVRETHFLICSDDITTTQLPIKHMIEIA
jgi:hypothetical protein